MTLGTARPGAARPGATVPGRAARALTRPDPPDDLDDIDWDPDASPPDDPPSEPSVIVPEVAFQLLERDGTHIAWLNYAELLDWRRVATGGPGSASATLPRSLAVINDCVPPNMIRVWYRGRAVHDALIAPISDATYQEGEEGDEHRIVNAPGSRVIFNDFLVDPWRVTNRPVSDSQRFDFTHPDFQITDDWIWATELARQDDTTEHWTGLPAKWPGSGAAQWIAAPGDTTDDTSYTDAVDYYGRRQIVLPYGLYAAVWSADDACRLWTDMVAMGETRDFHGFQRSDFRMSANLHTFAVLFSNIAQLPTNPIGFLFSLHPVDTRGRLADAVLISDASWRLLPDPGYEPGWKIGRIVNYLLDRAEAIGGRRIYRGFTDDLDTAGDPWPIVSSLTFANNASLGEVLNKLEETWVDIRIRAGSFTLDLWNKGSRGVARATQLGSARDVAASSACIARLEHQTDPPYATRITAHYGDGYIARARNVPGFFIQRPLEIPNAITRGEVYKTLDALLDLFARPRVSYQADLVPRIDGHRPHIGFHEADTVPLKDPDGNWAQVPVQTIHGTYAPRGKRLTLDIEAGDPIIEEEDAIQAWLEQRAAGAFGGRIHQATSTQLELPPAQAPTVAQPLVFHRAALVTETESDPKKPGETSRIFEFTVTLGTAQGSDTDVDLKIDGSTIETATVPAGDRWAAVRLNRPVSKGVEDVSVACTDTGFPIVAEVKFE